MKNLPNGFVRFDPENPPAEGLYVALYVHNKAWKCLVVELIDYDAQVGAWLSSEDRTVREVEAYVPINYDIPSLEQLRNTLNEEHGGIYS